MHDTVPSTIASGDKFLHLTRQDTTRKNEALKPNVEVGSLLFPLPTDFQHAQLHRLCVALFPCVFSALQPMTMVTLRVSDGSARSIDSPVVQMDPLFAQKSVPSIDGAALSTDHRSGSTIDGSRSASDGFFVCLYIL